ncbi:MAG: FAD-dependent oxidoreductase, partial [Rhodoferax sp.]|nr:FAD-dependent oxidoreductase [Rhodoferax sp.]
MIRLNELKLPLTHAPADLDALVQTTLSVAAADVARVRIFKRSVDARKAALMRVYIVDVELARDDLEQLVLLRCAGDPHVSPTPDMDYRLVGVAPLGASSSVGLRPVVVGFGPCGIFAALLLAQMGFKPIVLERGKTVRERTKDTWDFWRKGVLHPESNVQFGEGGAGTFSDGKLWSQIKDPRYLGRKVMQEFVRAGAPEDILVDAHPHIGTFKLVK